VNDLVEYYYMSVEEENCNLGYCVALEVQWKTKLRTKLKNYSTQEANFGSQTQAMEILFFKTENCNQKHVESYTCM